MYLYWPDYAIGITALFIIKYRVFSVQIRDPNPETTEPIQKIYS